MIRVKQLTVYRVETSWEDLSCLGGGNNYLFTSGDSDRVVGKEENWWQPFPLSTCRLGARIPARGNILGAESCEAQLTAAREVKGFNPIAHEVMGHGAAWEGV